MRKSNETAIYLRKRPNQTTTRINRPTVSLIEQLTMSVPLKPLSIDFHNRQLDSKQKKFHANIERALQHFDSVTEWADYIASLGKLLKALQSWTPQFQNVKYYVPFPYQVSRRLSSSLSPNLPSGVHLKTIEVYSFIFSKIGIDSLSRECNIWVPGILPLMSYASITVKGPLIELYEDYLNQLSPSALRLLIKPLLASLFPDIDDESSESQPATLNLLETLRENIADEPLFWQSCFMVIINNKERRLGGLAWLTKYLPSLNAVPHKVQRNKTGADTSQRTAESVQDSPKLKRQSALDLLLPAAKDVIHPEPGLLMRCLLCCLEEDNELLIKRGILDLLLQRVNLDSPVLQELSSSSDRNLLMMSCCKTMLTRDMSISRRIWNWLLGPASIGEKSQKQAIDSNDYFSRYGEKMLESGLRLMIDQEDEAPDAYKICLAVMDRWEIASRIIPITFIPLISAAYQFRSNNIIMKNASAFFDAVETNIICSHLFETAVLRKDLNLLKFILCNFKIGHDEEIIIRHLPLLLLAILCRQSDFDDAMFLTVCDILINFIPERAYLPVEHSSFCSEAEREMPDVFSSIERFYSRFLGTASVTHLNESSDSGPPFSTEDLTFLIFSKLQTCLLSYSKEACNFNICADVFVTFIDKVPKTYEEEKRIGAYGAGEIASNCLVRPIIKQLFDSKQVLESGSNESIFGWIAIYNKYLAIELSVMEAAMLSKTLVKGLWPYLVASNTQIEAVKSLDELFTCHQGKYLESALSFAFVQESDINIKISALDALWIHSENVVCLARRPLELVLDELFDDQTPSYLCVSRWVSGVIKQGHSKRLFHILCENLLKHCLLQKSSLDELDDTDSFVYYCQILINTLQVDHSLVLKSFKAEQTSLEHTEDWEGEDISNYKNLAIAVSIKFLKIKNTTGSSVQTVLTMLDILLDSTEQDFQNIVTFLLDITSKTFNASSQESDLICVSLMGIISKVLALSYREQIRLGILADHNSHLRYIDFLVTGVSDMRRPLIINSYVKLLSESLVYFQSSIYSIILPLTTSITGCIKTLFDGGNEKGENFQSIAYLLNGLQELMEISHSYLSAEESGGHIGAAPSRNEFLQNMVANVFSNDTSGNDARLRHEREIVVQSYKLVVHCCLDIWNWAHLQSKSQGFEKSELEAGLFQDSSHHQAYKYKSHSKKLLSALFTLEPLEVLEELISLHPDNISLTLIQSLDGNKPILTLPHLFQAIVYRCNKLSAVNFSNTTASKVSPNPLLINQLSANTLLKFMLNYMTELESAAVEDFYGDFLLFIKEISNSPQHYKNLSPLLLRMVALISDKVHHSRFGEERKVKRELSDTCSKYLQGALAEEVNPLSLEVYRNLKFVCSRLKYIVVDYPLGDKFNSCLSTIIQSAISPVFKKQQGKTIPAHVIDLLYTVSQMASKVKAFKSLINDAFVSDKKFALFETHPLWSKIVFEWSNYADNKERLMIDLLASISTKSNAIGPNINPFTAWSDSEIEIKCHDMVRISYLLLISPRDYYLLNFKTVMVQLEQNLMSEDPKIRSCCYLLLRCVSLQFSPLHFAEYWSMLSYHLQTGLQKFYESLQMQQDTDANVVLQLAKCIDLILTLNFEEFSASYEWLFVIDTINCIYKTDPYISLADEISDCKDFMKSEASEFELADHSKHRAPLLRGIRDIQTHTQLRKFFLTLSYAHYEQMYSLEKPDESTCRDDVFGDIFAFIAG
ncbi:LADA_0F02212g1_1 [Lachancea dasiensis]|uniref:LADA_0F02212g1_1 n=1 Tax=Lachancea dasiensis TaxID=1072105 RepID=A0A1G4JIH0_9SACH|nr:LADA_0F02212g1_1 [Lachancea dasiensis]